MPKEILYLDLNKVDLYVSENMKSDLVIESIIKGIELGDDIPAVPVSRIDETTYELADIDDFPLEHGGNHRAVSYFISNMPMKSVILAKRKELSNKLHVKDVILVNDSQLPESDRLDFRKKAYSGYR